MTLFKLNSLNGRKPSWHIQNVMTNHDSFGSPIPSFSLKGQEKVNTAIGGCLTILMWIILLVYASDKALELYKRQNPIINVINKPAAIDESEIINIGASNFRFAFSLETDYAK